MSREHGTARKARVGREQCSVWEPIAHLPSVLTPVQGRQIDNLAFDQMEHGRRVA